MSNEIRGAEQARATSKRKAILDAATSLMVAGGLRRVTHRQVAAEAGVPVGSVGYYYSSREQLIDVCFSEIHMRRRAVAETVLAQATRGRSKREVAEDVIAIATAGHPEGVPGLVYSIVDAKRELEDPIRARVNEQISQAFELIDALLERSGYSNLTARGAAHALIGAGALADPQHENSHDCARAALVAALEATR
ncbi:TetR/AcrR family transcriptional regulator [Corynebacterium timonense]|uniref:Regulatory protein, tetR family n=1 Tax=Corynebacterium timonense TaxID=441500 RepID=A0A1H1LWA1_9CORY|nr:TetR family transcriptional regulator [Corynebacterium timonense]SDR78680.1 regulatory protein, tetR family [Corynebacterium timonense]